MLSRLALRAMFIALATLPTAGALVASADDGPPPGQDAPGRAPLTVLRDAPAARREVVVLVGGLGSSAQDSSFDAVIAALGDRYDVVRFGADPAHPYDTLGPIDSSARELAAQVRELGSRSAGVSIIAHSMGATVADRAIGSGLSGADGLTTYVALAAPHQRPAISIVAGGVLALAGPDAVVLRAALSPLRDPGTPAVGDLADARATSAPEGVARLDLRLATDQLVLAHDSATPGVETRTLLPSTARGLEGHGGALADPRVLALTREAIESRRAPVDTRSGAERAVTGVVARVNDGAVELALAALALLLLGVVVALKRQTFASRVLLRPLARRVLEAGAR